MADRPRERAALPGQIAPVSTRLRYWFVRSWPGRLLLLGGLLKILAPVLDAAPPGPAPVNVAGSLALVLAGAVLLARGLSWVRRRLLWRVRRKLILSYVFVGLVPSLLIFTFFMLAGLLLFRNVASYLVQTRLNAHTEQARFLAQTALLDVQRAATAEAARDTLERQEASSRTTYPHLSMTLVAAKGITCPETLLAPNASRVPPVVLPLSIGEWRHLPAPVALPKWVTCEGATRIVAYSVSADPARLDLRLVARAVALPPTKAPAWAVIVDLPIAADVERRLLVETGIQLGAILPGLGDDRAQVEAGAALEARALPPPSSGFVDQLLRRWVMLVDHTRWNSGDHGMLRVELVLHPLSIYRRIIDASPDGGTLSNVLLGLLLAVGVMFLLIQAVAMVLGLTLARQITGAVHDLFTGTEHLRNRDFTHVIPVRARDQLGELADSFNVMTGEVTRLLVDVAKKERLEQEFATAREIQMKLLPHGPLLVPGLTVSAYCEPAREVGGDYYDVFPIDDQTFGFLIADVSGKGVGAGLYMAQLKGLLLSLARQHRSPRELLVAVNRAIAEHLDGRSFITMSYLVIDLRQRVMTYARAGHCPLIMVPGARGGVAQTVKVLAPDGLVVGLKIDDGSMFESLLEEVTVPLVAGDLIVLFTDGVSEMMNPTHDCFGESRLGELAGEYRDLPLDVLAGRLVDDVRAFAAGAGQHDDMTMVLLRVDAARVDAGLVGAEG